MRFNWRSVNLIREYLFWNFLPNGQQTDCCICVMRVTKIFQTFESYGIRYKQTDTTDGVLFQISQTHTSMSTETDMLQDNDVILRRIVAHPLFRNSRVDSRRMINCAKERSKLVFHYTHICSKITFWTETNIEIFTFILFFLFRQNILSYLHVYSPKCIMVLFL